MAIPVQESTSIQKDFPLGQSLPSTNSENRVLRRQQTPAAAARDHFPPRKLCVFLGGENATVFPLCPGCIERKRSEQVPDNGQTNNKLKKKED